MVEALLIGLVLVVLLLFDRERTAWRQERQKLIEALTPRVDFTPQPAPLVWPVGDAAEYARERERMKAAGVPDWEMELEEIG